MRHRRREDVLQVSPSRPSARAQLAAHLLGLDAAAAEISSAFRRAGIASVLLKGRSLALWLYDDRLERLYVDVDLLIEESNFAAASSILDAHGFRQTAKPKDDLTPWIHVGWFRTDDGARLELHRSLGGVRAEPGHLWAALSRHSKSLVIADTFIDVLDDAGLALTTALHAAQHGPINPPLEDLRRALTNKSEAVWSDAYELASELDALDAFAAGLSLLEEGQALRDRLGIPVNSSTLTLLQSEMAPNAARFMAAFAETRGIGARARLVARTALPDPQRLRAVSRLARRGRLGLGAAYAIRPIILVGRGLRAWGVWRDARRRLREAGTSSRDIR